MHKLTQKSPKGESIEALFCPEAGMNLLSLKFGNTEIIDQNTRPLFEERMAGLGALIGPHFHHRAEADIPPLPNEDIFPFIKPLLYKGRKEVFSHGIGRYVPWHFEGDDKNIEASLFSEDVFKGVKLSELEGQAFELHYKAQLQPEGLSIEYSFTKEKPGVIGLHYYYALEPGESYITAKVAPKYHTNEGWLPLKEEWTKGTNDLKFSIHSETEADFGFVPIDEEARENTIQLHTGSRCMSIHYECSSNQNAFQVYRPKGATYVCIEPVTAKNPRDAVLTHGHLKVFIKII